MVALLRDDAAKLNQIKSIMKELAVDRSWRSRYMVAERIVEIQEAFKDKITLDEMVSIYTNLLKDTEGEVRDAAASKLHAFCAALPEPGRKEAVVNEILTVIKPLTSDANQHVKIALASVIMGLAPILGQENTVTHLLLIFLSMLHDDTPEVRLNIISSLDKVSDVIGGNELQHSVLPAIIELAEDGKWLFAIREAANETLRRLAEKFGAQWAVEMILPRVIELAEDTNYLHRMTCLFCFETLARAIGKDNIVNKLFPTLKKLAEDTVPNVRFNVAKVLGLIAKNLDGPSINAEVKPLLAKLSEDSEFDVRYFAEEAKESLSS
ncbi:Serine/threonine-protein phosphatase 2A 65 kDa regulatory subunit A beta isoform-like protein [Aphelenchoides besseyi]|nr:Serine/threonine-protein phosphatase 2A 65 kDa regulatory subunit A beta isoform-like protein [Aphelenchoides besseyi]